MISNDYPYFLSCCISGAGTTIDVLRSKKPLVVVINEDLMSNHQLEMAHQLKSDGHLIYSHLDSLSQDLLELPNVEFLPFPECNPKIFSDFMDRVMGF